MKSVFKNKGKKFKLTTLGYTLIELLSVIVILAIITLIATPIVLNIIKDSKSKLIKQSANIYIDTLEKEILKLNFKEKYNPNKCLIVDGNLNCDGEEIVLDIKGIPPKCGKINLKDGKIISYSINIENQLISKDESGKEKIESSDFCSIEVVELETGLTPVIYENGNWVITTEDDPKW